MEKFFANRRFHFMAAAIIAAATLIVYSNTFNAAFQLDDTHHILENEGIRDLRHLPALMSGLRGVSQATFALNYAAGGLDVRGYHAVNTVLHIFTAMLAYIFLYETFKLMKKDDVWSKKIAAFTALIFAVHPVQTQAVTYIVQRMEVMASLFYLLAVILFIKAAASQTRAKRGFLYAGIGASYLLAFYSKEIAYTLPAAILLYDICFISGGSLRGVLSRWPAYAVLAVFFAFFTITTVMSISGISGSGRPFGPDSPESNGRQGSAPKPALPAALRTAVSGSSIISFILPEAEAAAEPLQPEAVVQIPALPQAPDYPVTAGFKMNKIGPREYLYTQFNVQIYYLSLLLVPVNQNLDYDFPVASGLFQTPEVSSGAVLNIPQWPPIVSAVILFVIIAAAFYMLISSFRGDRPAARIIPFFTFWFFLLLLPTSSIIPIVDVINEHRVYLASLGFFTILVITIDMAIARIFGASRR
ncbi:MAG: hypothetical protein HZB82_03755 [Deltaproteobacteria bacterium]|nr:hypothetical protein [Deltaproteobacteria bacterium]